MAAGGPVASLVMVMTMLAAVALADLVELCEIGVEGVELAQDLVGLGGRVEAVTIDCAVAGDEAEGLGRGGGRGGRGDAVHGVSPGGGCADFRPAPVAA